MVAMLSVIIAIWHQDSTDEEAVSCLESSGDDKTGVAPVDPSGVDSTQRKIPLSETITTDYDKPAHDYEERSETGVYSSSVICWGRNPTERVCQFNNLYYLPREDEFVFVNGDDTVTVGVPSNRYSPALLDLSSVADHNLAYFNYADVAHAKAHLLLSNATVVNRTALIFRRFHADNLMHVFHDDLLPIFHTLKV